MLSEKVAYQFPSFTEQFEGRVSWMYVDIKGLITTGVGNLIDPMPAAMSLPWQIEGRPAEDLEIATAWQDLKDHKDFLSKWGYASCKARNDLRLTNDAIDELVRTKLQSNVSVFEKQFPAFGSWPDAIQMACMSMCWALGAAFAKRWPKFSDALQRQDWATAAEQCKISEAGNPGVVPRNKANKALFLSAVLST